MNADHRTANCSPRCFRDVLARIARSHSLRKVAEEIGVPPATMYNYSCGRATFPPELVAPLYLATDDREVIDFVLAGTDFIAVPKGKPAKGDVVAEVMRALALVADGKPPKGAAPALTRAAALLLAYAREA